MIAPRSTGRAARAFTLLEVMVAVAIMGVIVMALYAVFNQTQRALRTNANQTDVMEGGRFAMALLVSDLRSLTAAGVTPETNFISTLSPAINVPMLSALQNDLYSRYYVGGRPADWGGYVPVVQALNVRNERRTNVLGEVFLHSRTGARSSGVVYRVLNARGGVGTLARYAYEHPNRFVAPGTLSAACLLQPAASFAQVLDGIVHFRVQAYDPLGYPMTALNRGWYGDLAGTSHPNLGYRLGVDLMLEPDPRVATESLVMFRSNALPAAIEVEIGILDPESLAQFRALPEGSVFAERFLSNRAAQVQLFRQRIPIWQAPPLQSTASVRQ
jgi:prepilin-type N-terminal cleavage/methylation domain-containing protein